MEDFSKDLVKSVGSSELSSIAKEYGEKSLDALVSHVVDNPAIKEIPILRTIVGVSQGVLAFRDRTYIKKIMRFLFQVDESSEEVKTKFKEKMRHNPKEVHKAGETVWEILEKVSSNEKAIMIGKVFQAYMAEEITLNQLIYLCEIIERTYLQDLISVEKSEVHNDVNLENVGIKKPIRVEDINKAVEIAVNQAVEEATSRAGVVKEVFTAEPASGKKVVAQVEQSGFTDEGYELMRILRSY